MKKSEFVKLVQSKLNADASLKAADRAVGEGILDLNGTRLAPHSSVTRAKLVEMLYRMAGKANAGRKRLSLYVLL